MLLARIFIVPAVRELICDSENYKDSGENSVRPNVALSQ